MALTLTLNGETAKQDRVAVHSFIDKAFNEAEKMIADLVAEATSADQAAGAYQQVATDMAILAAARAKRVSELEAELADAHADLAASEQQVNSLRDTVGEAKADAHYWERQSRANAEALHAESAKIKASKSLIDYLNRKAETLIAERAQHLDTCRYISDEDARIRRGLEAKVARLEAELAKATEVDTLKFVPGCEFSAQLYWSQSDGWQLAVKVDRELSDDDHGVNEYDGGFAYVLESLVGAAARFNSDLA